MLDSVGVVMKKFSIPYREAVAKIAADREQFNTALNKLAKPQTPVFHIVESDMDFTYWDKYRIPRDIVKMYACQARTVYRNEDYYARSTKTNPIFVYKFKSGNIKLYRPLSTDPSKK